MIEFLTATNLAANSTIDAMTNSDQGEAQARFVDRPSQVTIAMDATAVGVETEIFAGARQIVARSALDAGGTAGVFPNFDQKAFSFFAAAGDKLRVLLRETAGTATTDVNLAISVEAVA